AAARRARRDTGLGASRSTERTGGRGRGPGGHRRNAALGAPILRIQLDSMGVPSHERRQTDEIAWNQRLPQGVASLVPLWESGSQSSSTEIVESSVAVSRQHPDRNEQDGRSWTSHSMTQGLLAPFEPTSCEDSAALAQGPCPRPTRQLEQQPVS